MDVNMLPAISEKFFSSVLPTDQEITSIKTEDGEIDQWLILSVTFHHAQYQSYPPNVKFCKQFIRKLIGIIEECGEEVAEDLYNVYLGFLSIPESHNGSFFKSFLIKNYLGKDNWLTLKESANIISNGTTGLSAWQAAYFMSEWVSCNKDLFHNKCIMELGSGTGLLGLSVCKTCQAENFIFTDHHGEVLKMLGENLYINGWMHSGKDDEVGANEDGCAKRYLPADSVQSLPTASVAFLDWERVADDDLNKMSESIDIVVASDVVFDTRIIPCLVRVIKGLLNPSTLLPQSVARTKAAYVCGAIRNQMTWDSFLEACGRHSMAVETVAFTPPNEEQRLFKFIQHSLEFQIVKLTSFVDI